MALGILAAVQRVLERVLVTLILLLLCPIVATLAYAARELVAAGPEYYWLMLYSPFVFGCWFGYIWRHVSLSGYILALWIIIGFIAAGLNLYGIIVFATPNIMLPPPYTPELLGLVSRVVIGGTFLFVAGELSVAFFSSLVHVVRGGQMSNEVFAALIGLVAGFLPVIAAIITAVTE